MTGVHVRNIIWECWVPWEAIATAVATTRVDLVQASGKRVTCWAVQKTNIAAMTENRSRTYRVTDRLLETRREQLADYPTPTPPAEITRCLARIPNWVVLLFCLYVVVASVMVDKSA